MVYSHHIKHGGNHHIYIYIYMYLHPLSSLKFKYDGYPSIFAKNTLKLKNDGWDVDSSVFWKFERFLHFEPFGLSEWCGLHIILCLSPGVPLESVVSCVCGSFVHSNSNSAVKVYLGRAPAEGTTGYGCFWSLASTGAAHPCLLKSWMRECKDQ